MRKIIAAAFILLFALSAVQATSSCQQACAQQKIQESLTVKELTNKLANCKPDFITCVNQKNQYSSCVKQHSECKWGTIKDIRNSKIQTNVKYSQCANACGQETSPQLQFLSATRTNEKMPTICMKINEIKPLLLTKFGVERLQKFIKNNNCQGFVGL